MACTVGHLQCLHLIMQVGAGNREVGQGEGEEQGGDKERGTIFS